MDRIPSDGQAKAHRLLGQSLRKSTSNVNNPLNGEASSGATANAGEAYPLQNAPVNSSSSSPLGNRNINDEKAVDTSPKPDDTTNYGQTPPVSSEEAEGTVIADGHGKESKKKPKVFKRVWKTTNMILRHSWINVLLIFVPVGIAVAQIPGIPAGVVFAVNAIAIIPLAGLLSHATESVAQKLGDAVGALLNVTFGNAVELIIFIIALSKDQIRIVQAALLGSILANLLLILGMCFFLGGLRFREQIYNSTVTQMSACLLSLSVCSLVLPTAFYASFKEEENASKEALKISRGCSVVLLLVYFIYLLFQLKSHAYMYESTPQHIVDAEATPGPVANWLDTSSSDSSSSSSSDSDGSSRSRETVRKKMKKVLRRRRKNSVASIEASESPFTRTPSFETSTINPYNEDKESPDSEARAQLAVNSAALEKLEEAAEEERSRRRRRGGYKRHKHGRNKKHRKRSQAGQGDNIGGDSVEPTMRQRRENVEATIAEGEPRRVDFALSNATMTGETSTSTAPGARHGARRPIPALRGMSIKNLAPPVFVQKPEPGVPAPVPMGPVPRVRYGIRRTNSLPDRLNQQQAQHMIRPPGSMFPAQIPLLSLTGGNAVEAMKLTDEEDDHLSRTSAVILLLVSTALVALCAEFLVDSIHDVVATSKVSEAFIGLIILPIVGNAAEHVTAITVALKNKMDLAIGVAVGSSIQIALFITPLVVILGWIMNHDMTLYFTLFETVCLFVSTFIVNFLVLDGRSNYLEGALLMSTYIIIGVIAAYYPDHEHVSQWG